MSLFRERWDAVRREHSHGTFERRIDASLPFYVTLENPGQLPGLLLRIEQSPSFDPAELKGSEKFSVSLTENGNETAIHLTTVSEDAVEIFLQMGEDLVPRVLDRSDPLSAAATLVRRFNTWQRFLRQSSGGALSEARRLGLFGELVTLRDLMIPTLGAVPAVEAWTGPDRAPQDFQGNRMAVEVKSIVHSEPQVLRIDGERQLDNFGLDLLAVAHHRMFRHRGSGTTLPELIEQLRVALCADPIAKDHFDDKLLTSGYDDTHAETFYSSVGYTIQQTSYYRVREGFPRLTEADLRAGMGDVVYSVAAAVCEKFEIEEGRLRAWLAEPESAVGSESTPESHHVEYKETVWTPVGEVENDAHRESVSRELQNVVVKTIAGFMNADGGELVIGVRDDLSISGISVDLENRGRAADDIDSYERDLWALLENHLDRLVHREVRVSFKRHDAGTTCHLAVAPSPAPRFARPHPKPNEKPRMRFWVRAGNRTVEREGQEMVEYINRHWA